MRDVLGWSFPLGRVFGITVRVHWLFPLVAAGMVLRAAYQKDAIPNAWIDIFWVVIILFFSVLLHEFGHCFAARRMEGEANEILMWPLGGLAFVEVPHTPRANLVTAAAGPFVNIILGGTCLAILLFVMDCKPPWDLLHAPTRTSPTGEAGVVLEGLGGQGLVKVTQPAELLVIWGFWTNYFLAVLNLVLIGFPLDGGRIFQAALWPWVGYRRAMLAAIFAGFIVMLILAIGAIIINEILPLALAAFIYFSCKNQWIMLETGGEESLLGYDFSQGYTSLERDDPAPAPRRKVGWFARWRQRRAARRLQRDQEQRLAEEERMDALLQKVQTQGVNALTDEERRFMKRVSDRYRNRK
jgi:Zn-dependent protease